MEIEVKKKNTALCKGDVVELKDVSAQGVVRFLGHVHFSEEVFCGVELTKPSYLLKKFGEGNENMSILSLAMSTSTLVSQTFEKGDDMMGHPNVASTLESTKAPVLEKSARCNTIFVTLDQINKNKENNGDQQQQQQEQRDTTWAVMKKYSSSLHYAQARRRRHSTNVLARVSHLKPIAMQDQSLSLLSKREQKKEFL
ncbi:hypothetical protein RFI_07966 [Reticulomyxa filosa]|uniref:Uncharacterized protein n=1 Tax=Reticulomyxa filosa TaxID=46433 RepID=X6NTR0_RETFI|nr:hypothetical protein RFI_07966 [Reticulomyxa filosa]|eukprot:ETO29159.1 hypothetical protein RFI_07966 [Reticulomyxa filosa]